MSSEERWRQLEELYHSALERAPVERARFLEEVCGGDLELYREVESLLAAEDQAGDFLASPAVEVAAQDLAGEKGRSFLGRTVGQYRILSLLGSGGMGEVYRARDTRLGREVAIKVMPEAFSRSKERLARFEREARVLASLNHPGIATLYGFEQSEGTRYLVMELVDGEKLSDVLHRERLPLARALDLASEVAAGLARAHDQGVIHRDLKPANIMVTKEGHAKIIDFGVAKLYGPVEGVDSDLQTSTQQKTGSRVLLGTAPYMSPEQARGEEVDRRTDLFAFGIILHELLSRKNPFERRSVTETLAAILTEPAPPLSSLAGELPAHVRSELQRVVDRCLAKDREGRYQATRDLEIELRSIRRLAEGDAVAPLARQAAIDSRTKAVAVASLLAMTLGALAYVLWLRAEPVPRLSDPVQITRSIGGEAYPAWSPDGGRIAFHLNTKGDETSFDIWVTQIAGGDAVRLTDYPGGDRWPTWSPDGSRIAFWSEREGGGYFVMSALGGSARKLIGRPPEADPWWAWWARPQWSPDGQELAAVILAASGPYAEIVALASGESRRWALPGRSRSRQDLSWSPDGRYLAYVDGAAFSELTQLRVLRIEDEEAVSLTDGRTRVSSPSWSADGRFLYYVSNRGGSMDLWRQKMRRGYAEGDPYRITTGVGMTSAAFSPDGRRVAYSLARLVSNVWRVPILAERAATWADAEQITFDEALIGTLHLSSDGMRLAVGSDRSGNPDVWILPSEGGEMQQLTSDPAPQYEAAWSPSADEVAFDTNRSETVEIWVQPVAGGPARRLAEGNTPRWSPDGRSILFSKIQDGNEDIWVVAAEGGEPRRVTTHPSDDRGARWSPDGSSLAFWSTRSGKEGIWRLAAEGDEPELLAEDGYGPCWSRDGRWIYYVGVGGKSGTLWSVSVDGKVERPMTEFSGRRGGPGAAQASLACGGAYLYFSWREDRGDIWVADVLQD